LNLKSNSVRQIDFLPTLSLLLGLPIPFSNLGIVILDFFRDMELKALNANYDQVSFMKELIKF
jgi:GPI ethanolamine phosphate transferase 3 subunit O